jgi:hypothetical protein
MVQGSQHPIMVHTDHQALVSVLKSDDAHGRISRWAMKLAEFNLVYNHVPGKEMAVADGLSRFGQVVDHPFKSFNTLRHINYVFRLFLSSARFLSFGIGWSNKNRCAL